MITNDIKEFVDILNFIYSDKKYTLQKHKRVRKHLFNFLSEKINGLKTDEDFLSINFLNEKIGDLMDITNKLLLARNENSKNVMIILAQSIKELNNKTLSKIRVSEELIKEINSIKASVQDKIKVIIEEDEIYIFFENEELLNKFESELINNFSLELDFKNIKKINSIGMIKGQSINKNINDIILCMKKTLNDNFKDFIKLSESEIIIYLNNSNKE